MQLGHAAAARRERAGAELRAERERELPKHRQRARVERLAARAAVISVEAADDGAEEVEEERRLELEREDARLQEAEELVLGARVSEERRRERACRELEVGAHLGPESVKLLGVDGRHLLRVRVGDDVLLLVAAAALHGVLLVGHHPHRGAQRLDLALTRRLLPRERAQPLRRNLQRVQLRIQGFQQRFRHAQSAVYGGRTQGLGPQRDRSDA